MKDNINIKVGIKKKKDDDDDENWKTSKGICQSLKYEAWMG